MSGAGAAPAIRIRGLTKTLGGHRALDGIDLDVPAGSVCGLLGPNGAGKTTTVRVVSTLLRPDEGRVLVHGHDVRREPTAVRSLIGLTGQYAALDQALTARDNLTLIARLLGVRRPRRRADDLLEEFSLTDAARRPVSGLSGGMRRRLDLAASLVHRPAVLVLDEPTTGLDPRTRAQMWETVRTLVAGGSTVLLTTQYLEEADQLADRVVVLDHGRVVADGTAAELKASVARPRLHLRVTPAHEGAAAAVLAAVTGESADHGGPGRLSVPIASSAVTADVVLALRDRDVEVVDLGVHQPSLDEVFLALTRPARRSGPQRRAVRGRHAARSGRGDAA